MHLSTNLASKIISEVQQVMKEDIILVDTKGIIISSTEKSRIGTFHEGATIVIKTKKVLYIDQDKAKILKGVKAGINMPIMFNKQVIGVIGITGDPKKVEPFAELIRRMTELIIQEAYYTDRNEWEIRGIESYLYEWINSTSVDKEFLERGVMLGIPVYDTHICALIQSEIQTLDHYDIPRIQKEIMELFYSVFGKENHFLIRWGQERFLLLKKIGSTFNKNHFHSQLKNFKERFERKYHHHLAIGVGKTMCRQIIHRSFKEAMKALKVAQKHLGIVFYEDLILEIILEDIPIEIQKDFQRRTIDVLKEDPILIDTLQHYLHNNQSIKKTSEEMNIHINTLHYRLNKIEELTGINPKTTEGIVIFYISLMLLNSHSHHEMDKRKL